MYTRGAPHVTGFTSLRIAGWARGIIKLKPDSKGRTEDSRVYILSVRTHTSALATTMAMPKISVCILIVVITFGRCKIPRCAVSPDPSTLLAVATEWLSLVHRSLPASWRASLGPHWTDLSHYPATSTVLRPTWMGQIFVFSAS
jgi:hypothetical protein